MTSAAGVRALERTAATLTADDLAVGKTVRLANYLADPVEMKLLHMITGDPKRTATLALFGNPDFWLDSSLPSSCPARALVCEPAGGDAWNHGDVAPEINTTWLGLVGPGVTHAGVDRAIWSDHTDIQPTMMALLGLKDDYTPDGVVIGDVIESAALPPAMLSNYPTLNKLGRVYTQLEAAVGEFGLATLTASTRALASNSPGDGVYSGIENQLAALGAARNALVAQMQALLTGAEFGGKPISANAARLLISQGNALLTRASTLARG